MADTDKVTVEFFGIPRQRAGRSEVRLTARTVAELLTELERACPGLKGIVGPGGRLTPHYLLSINGERFVTGEQESLPPGAQILLLSADAGG